MKTTAVPALRLSAAALLAALTFTAPLASAQIPAAAAAARGMQPAAKPGDDFWTYTNGGWIAATEIPADRSSWGASGILIEDTNKRIVGLIDQAATAKPGSAERKVSDYYKAYMDQAAIDARGTAPLAPALKKIEAIATRQDLARVIGGSIRADVDALNSTDLYTENLFGFWTVQGLNDPARYTPYLMQGGLGMPDRAYYLDDSPRMADLRTKYVAHIAAMLKLAGMTDADARAQRIFDLERKIAAAHGTREESSDVTKAQTWKRADFAKKAPGMDWNAFFGAAGLSKPDSFILWQPSAVVGSSALVASEPIEVWKDYLAFHTYNHFADVLPKAFGDQHFAFNGTALSGTPQQQARTKRALTAVNNGMEEAVGKMYVEKYFPPEAKKRVQDMVTNIVAAFQRRVDRLDWMAPATKAQAHAKLKALYVGVGYPEKWVKYDGLEVRADDALGNAMRAEEFAYRTALAKVGKPVDKHEWCMPPHLVNAVNMPMQNALNFPAAILQPPYFDMKASDAHNYGAIGSIIGHEITHSFDDQGAQFDSHGRLRNWWTPADLKHFQTSSQALVNQYSAYKPFPDLAINGQQTLSENIADIGGLAAALDAYHVSLKGKPAPVVDGLSGDQQFFIAFGQSWRTKPREAALRRQVITDGHAPAQYRTMTVRNMDEWYKAFDVQQGQQMYLEPNARVRIW
ncbi:MAG TPA: M13 family metallopeptidase [Burkholderiaceae bacterium]